MSYRAVLRTPHALRTFVAALVGRLSYGIVFVSLTVALTGATGSYSPAGGAIALFGLGVVAGRAAARRADRPARAAAGAAAHGRRLRGPAGRAGRRDLAAGRPGLAPPGARPPRRARARHRSARSCAPCGATCCPTRPAGNARFALDTVAEELLFVHGAAARRPVHRRRQPGARRRRQRGAGPDRHAGDGLVPGRAGLAAPGHGSRPAGRGRGRALFEPRVRGVRHRAGSGRAQPADRRVRHGAGPAQPRWPGSRRPWRRAARSVASRTAPAAGRLPQRTAALPALALAGVLAVPGWRRASRRWPPRRHSPGCSWRRR